jgi:hypothetical protein
MTAMIRNGLAKIRTAIKSSGLLLTKLQDDRHFNY